MHIDAGGHRLSFQLSGTGPPHFVCLHGLADTLEIWDGLTQRLAEHGQVIRFDQRAHGDSGAPAGPYRREDLAGDVCALLTELDVSRALLVGHSMGGIVAMCVALTEPERVAGLVLLGTASECSAKVAGWYERIARAGERDGIEGIRTAIYGARSRREIRGDAQGLAHVTRCLKSLHADPLTPKLATLRCPTLLLAGERDPMGPGASVILQRAVPGSKLEVVPGRGHWLHVEAPDTVFDAMSRYGFLSAQAGVLGLNVQDA